MPDFDVPEVDVPDVDVPEEVGVPLAPDGEAPLPPPLVLAPLDEPEP